MLRSIAVSFLLALLLACDQSSQLDSPLSAERADRMAGNMVSAAPTLCLPNTVSVNSLIGACGAVPATLPALTSGFSYTATSDLSRGAYSTFLYSTGNTKPAHHKRVGDSLALLIKPLSVSGQPSPNGSIVVIGEGMSNARYIFDAFASQLTTSKLDNPKVKFKNLSQSGCDLTCWVGNGAGAVDPQVQVALLYHSNNRPQNGVCVDEKRFPYHAQMTRDQLEARVHQLKQKYPNLKLIYLTSRDFGGWSCPPSGSEYREPVGYEEGFSVKWLIDGQSAGSDADLAYGTAPYLAWGPYLWSATTSRSYFMPDGTHPCSGGQAFFAQQWFDFLLNDSSSQPWFEVKR